MRYGLEALFLFGFGLVVFGMIWLSMKDAVDEIIADYFISSDAFDLMLIGYNVTPTIVFLLGIICLGLAGLLHRHGGGTVVVET